MSETYLIGFDKLRVGNRHGSMVTNWLLILILLLIFDKHQIHGNVKARIVCVKKRKEKKKKTKKADSTMKALVCSRCFCAVSFCGPCSEWRHHFCNYAIPAIVMKMISLFFCWSFSAEKDGVVLVWNQAGGLCSLLKMVATSV